MSTATLNSAPVTPAAAKSRLTKVMGKILPKSRKAALTAYAIFGVAIALVGLGLTSLFFYAPISLPILGAAWGTYGLYELFQFTQGWQSRKAWVMATLRFSYVVATALVLVAGLVGPWQFWAVGVTGVLIYLLAKVVCGNNGRVTIAQKYGETQRLGLS